MSVHELTSLKYRCDRKITHDCRYRSNVQLIIYANDYSSHGTLLKLESSINDVTLIWKYFRRYLCFNENQITVRGCINFDGKIVPWRKRYNSPLNEGGDGGAGATEACEGAEGGGACEIPKITYFYYSGHGNSDGTLGIRGDIPICDFNIIDACHSHKWKNLKPSYIISTSDENNITVSNKMISLFTLNLIKLLIEIPEYDELIPWIKKNRYSIDITEEKYKFFINYFIN